MNEDLERLQALFDRGAISEEEYEREKQRILNEQKSTTKESTTMQVQEKKLWGMTEQAYCSLMHLAQFAGLIVPLAGFILPIVMWITGKDDNALVDKHGRMILNWMISLLIWAAVCSVFVIIGIGVIALIVLGILNIIFVIKGAIEANKGGFYNYPLTIKIL